MQFLIFPIHVFMAKGCLISLERKEKMNQLKPLPQIQRSTLIFFQLGNLDFVSAIVMIS